MTTPIQSIESASDELNDIHAEVLGLGKRIDRVQETVRRVAAEASVSDSQVYLAVPSSVRISSGRRPLKTTPELTANVQSALNLETKKEAEIVIGAVVDALEHTLLNNLGIEGFSLKLGGFGKFKVRHTKPITRRVGFSGETVITKGKRKIRFVPLGMLRASETGN